MKRKKYKLYLKNIISICLPTILPVVLLGGFAINFTENYISQTVRDSNQSILKQIKVNVRYLLEEVDGMYLNYVTNPEVAYRLDKICKAEEIDATDYKMLKYISNTIKIPLYGKEYVHSLYFYFKNDKGRFFTTTNGMVLDGKFSDMEWYESYVGRKVGRDRWSEVREVKDYDFEDKGTEVITLYSLIRRNTFGTRDNGVMILNIHKSYIEKILSSIEAASTHHIFIVNDENQYIAGNMQELDDSCSEEEWRENLRGDKYEIDILDIERYGWKIYSVIPKDVLYQVPNALKQVVLYLVLILVLMGVVVNYLFVKHNQKKLHKIVRLLDAPETDEDAIMQIEEEEDDYSYINHKIREYFMMQRYLEVQLSQRKYKMQTYQLLALQAQINPHFLYNTLETIYWKSFQFTCKPNDVTYMIENLSDVLKYSLHYREEKVTFKEELYYTKSYVCIQEMRYKDKFKMVWKYGEEILNYQCVQLMLQPLIENALYHGIKEKEGNSIIRIKIQQYTDNIGISVLDTGMGMKKERLEELRKQLVEQQEVGSSIGLMNTNRRLQLIYGEHVHLKIYSKEGQGTIVCFRLPKANNDTKS